MKAAETRISHWAVVTDFAQTLWVAIAAGLGFSLALGAIVVLMAGVASVA